MPGSLVKDRASAGGDSPDEPAAEPEPDEDEPLTGADRAWYRRRLADMTAAYAALRRSKERELAAKDEVIAELEAKLTAASE